MSYLSPEVYSLEVHWLWLLEVAWLRSYCYSLLLRFLHEMLLVSWVSLVSGVRWPKSSGRQTLVETLTPSMALRCLLLVPSRKWRRKYRHLKALLSAMRLSSLLDARGGIGGQHFWLV